MPSPIELILERIKLALTDLESQDVYARVALDRDASIIKIYSEDSDHVKRAHSGLADVQELAYTTAEHHPYWAILYHANEISRIVLDKWDSELAADQISEMSWRCDEIKMALQRLLDK